MEQQIFNVFLYLIPIFILLGLYLIFYFYKRGKLIKNFAKNNNLSYNKNNPLIERELEVLNFNTDKSLIRSFSQIQDIVSDNNISLFRCVELLDLNPYNRSVNNSFNRIATKFNISQNHNLFITFKSFNQYFNRDPLNKNPNQESIQKIQQLLQKYPNKHKITITLKNKIALVYLEPLVTGGEKLKDLEYLFNFSKQLKRIL